jgi:thiamine pyrophosphokinase
MRAIIFTNGEFADPESARQQLRPGDLIIAADGGTRHALTLGIAPNVVIGDLDSLSPDEQARAEATGAQVIRFSPRKDETDLELALLHAARAGAGEIVVLGALGGRLDQTIANVLLLALPALRGIDVRIVEGAQEAFLVRDEALVHGQPGDALSLIPLGGDALGVAAEGVEWPLRDETLRFGLTRGVSNILVGEQARVGVRKGILLCVVTRRTDKERGKQGDKEKGGF